MAAASTGTSRQTVSTISRGVLSGLSKLGGVRPRSDADFTCPGDDSPELMLVTRDFLYGMKEAKIGDATCAFPKVNLEDDDGDEPMVSGTKVEEDVLIRLARHLLFACGNVREEAFSLVLLFVVGSFGRHCRNKSCSRGEECALRDVTAVFDPAKPVEYAMAVLELKTPISVCAKIVRDMRNEALEGGRLSLFEHVAEKHAALLASLCYPSAYPQSLKAKCFSVFNSYIAEDGKFFSTTPPNIASVLGTFDGQTKTYFPSTPEDCTELLKAELAHVTRRDYHLHEYGKIGRKKARGSASAQEQPAAAEAAAPSQTQPAAAGARQEGSPGAAAANAAEEELGWNQIKAGLADMAGSSCIQKLAVAEMNAKPEDGQETVRIGRVVLMPSGAELVVGKALNARSAIASHHVPPMTIRRFPRIVFDPAPAGKALAYAGGGEASALADIAELKRYGRVSMAPDYDHPEPVLEAFTMEEVRMAGNPNYNRFRGFHGDHAYAAFHPSDVSGHGVFTPDMKIPADLVAAGAQGFLAAGAAMMLPTVAVFFAAGTAVTEDDYAAGARSIRKHCIGLAAYLGAAAKWHTSQNVGSRGPTERLATSSFAPVVELVRRAGTFSALVKLVDAAGYEREAGNKRAAATVLMLAATYYPAVLTEYREMINDYIKWREEKDEGMRKPQKFISEAAGAAETFRRAATLAICGYIFMPDAADGSIGLTDVFQLSGEGIRYGEFDVLPLSTRGFQHGVLAVSNNLAGGLVGYRVRGHAAHTLKMAHRIIMRDAVKTFFGEKADWAGAEAARAWLPQPEEMWVVRHCSARELVLQRKDADEELVLEMAVHTCASSSDSSGTVVPLVFSPANELVFERSTRCTRGASGTEREQHGAQLLRDGDEVTVWTTPSAEDPGRTCLVAARCLNLECALIPSVDGLEGLAFDIVDNGTPELPTPLEVVNAVIAFGVVHRQPSTVIPYLCSPTKTGVETTPGAHNAPHCVVVVNQFLLTPKQGRELERPSGCAAASQPWARTSSTW